MSLSYDRVASTRVSVASPRNSHRHIIRLILLTTLVAILPLSLVVAGASSAFAQPDAAPTATFVVNTLSDLPDVSAGDGICETDVAGECSLRAAIMEANALAGPDTIDLSGLAGVIMLDGSALPTISENLIIEGPSDASALIIDASSDDRHLFIGGSAAVEIARVHLTNGAAYEGNGGSIYNAGSLTLTGVIISSSYADGDGGAVFGAGESSTIIQSGSQIGLPDQGNSAGYGGGVATFASSLVIDDSTIGHNYAYQDGGGVYNWGGTVTIRNQSVIEENRAQMRGGGIYNNASGAIEIIDSTVAFNATAGDGGGMYNYYSELTLVNATVSGNSAYGSGGGIVEESTDTLYLYNATITDNTADVDADGWGDGGGLVAGGSISIVNSILADNADLSAGAEISVHPDCTVWYFPDVFGNSFNVVGDNSGCEDIFVDARPGGADLGPQRRAAASRPGWQPGPGRGRS